MFDVGMGEIGLIVVVALLVLGPERLPRAARTAGLLVRKARSSWQSVRAEIERELAAEDLKRQIKEAAAAVDVRPHLQEAVQSVHDAVQAQPPAPAGPAVERPASPGTADHPSIHPAADTHER